MRVLCIGVGGVGEAIARISKDREFITLLVLAGMGFSVVLFHSGSTLALPRRLQSCSSD